MAVYEYGSPVHSGLLKKWSNRAKLQAAWELVDVLDYLEHHPAGQLRYADFKMNNFLLIGDRIKISDLDWVSSDQTKCNLEKPEPCQFGFCVDGVCRNETVRKHMGRFYQYFGPALLQLRGVQDFSTKRKLKLIHANLKSLNITARQLRDDLKSILEENLG